jgi:hypothetical protein
MSTNHKHGVLVALDDSEAAEVALRYVSHMTAGRPEFRIHLLHLLRPVPRSLRGGDDAEEDEELRDARGRWITQAEERVQPLFERAREELEAGGIAPADIATECRLSFADVSVARDCIEAARNNGCWTIAIGRESLPWYRDLFHRHACDEIVRHAAGFTVWVVEWEPSAEPA